MRFATEITLVGPWRRPAQMLADQTYDGHASVHDDATAAALGLAGAPIEGPTHFSQFDPLATALWRDRWFEEGCISCHFQTMVVEGEQVQASLVSAGGDSATISAHNGDGGVVLVGTASVGGANTSELSTRMARSRGEGPFHIVDQLEVGMRQAVGSVSMSAHESNGHLYPFSLDDKLARITEPHPYYSDASESPWGARVVPFEMISVLAHRRSASFPVRTPSVGLFLDLEVQLVAGPVLVGEEYDVVHEIVALGQTRKTESYWTQTTLTSASSGTVAATVLLHQGVFKHSYPGYPSE
ncbi:MAG: hypothetical protein RI958_1297 [Actinomycetota bacterium]|jgi:hypothetical protein